MFPHRLATAFVAALLLSTTGCIKEPELSVGTGSYQFNGILKRCEVQSEVTYPVANNQTYDQLAIILFTTPEPATGPENVVLTFTKERAQPTTAYQLTDMRYQTVSGVSVAYPLNTVHLQEDRGHYAGTFAGTASTSSTPALVEITEGTFTGVRTGE